MYKHFICFYNRIISIYVTRSHFVFPWVGRHLGCFLFWLLWIVQLCMCICVYVDTVTKLTLIKRLHQFVYPLTMYSSSVFSHSGQSLFLTLAILVSELGIVVWFAFLWRLMVLRTFRVFIDINISFRSYVQLNYLSCYCVLRVLYIFYLWSFLGL